MGNELLPCPFCGGEDLEIDHAPTYDVRHPDVYEVHCVECGGRGGEGWTEAEAIAAWNTRAEMSHEDLLILLDELGLSERTCKSMTDDNAWCFACSECGKSFPRSKLHLAHNHGEINYCPNCGAKVVDE